MKECPLSVSLVPITVDADDFGVGEVRLLDEPYTVLDSILIHGDQIALQPIDGHATLIITKSCGCQISIPMAAILTGASTQVLFDSIREASLILLTAKSL